MNLKKHYSLFLKNDPKRLHFASHSHHYWPDVSLIGQKQAWFDACEYTDHKWGNFFQNIYPQTQKLIAQILKLSHPEQIVFAPNTHELFLRLLSSFFEQEKIKILTTDSEFHSFSRQLKRLSEWNKFDITVISTAPYETFVERFCEKSQEGFDFVYLSQVFYNSGYFIHQDQLKKIVDAFPQETTICIDGYHSFCAVPVDLSHLQDRIFYLAGGYKYAQAGEGVCFLTVPSNCQLRPLDTGWFAGFHELEGTQKNQVTYSNDAMRFAGSTYDPTAFYRFNCVWENFFHSKVTIERIDNHVKKLQILFLELCLENSQYFPVENLLSQDLKNIGHFLCFEFQEESQVKAIHQQLLEENILTDYRGKRLRVGFGLYQDEHDVREIFKRLQVKKAQVPVFPSTMP